jgi:hypothetical protein
VAEELDAVTIAFAHRMFDLARAGADPAGGSPSAAETAEFFNLPRMSELLATHHGK